jgi:predicted  nucleic acid-binding Zn-ribbon protein
VGIPHRPALTRGAPLKADPSHQLQLLEVQRLDSTLDQLHHQIETLPESQRLVELRRERAGLDGTQRDAAIRVDDLTGEQKKADADVEQVRRRRQRDQDRMDQGLVSNPKDLERMQDELVSLQRRISDLEDVELDVMERLETAQSELGELSARTTQLDTDIAQLSDVRADKAGALERQVAEVEQERKVAAAELPEDLATLYARLRAQKGGVGAAELRARRCSGCSLELTAADLGAIGKAAPDEVLRCEECNRILVRTPESGL